MSSRVFSSSAPEQAYIDLTGRVRKTEVDYFACGGFSEVYRGETVDLPHVKLALKLLRGVHTDPVTFETVKRRLYRETRVWHLLVHPNILPFLGLAHELGPSPALVSPFYENGDALHYLKTHPNADRLSIIRGVAAGLAYLHANGVIHGDLKGHNVLVDDSGAARLADFGRSKLVDHRGFTTLMAGSTRFMAPELLIGPIDDGSDDGSETDSEFVPSLTAETDVYGFAMCCLNIYTGELPFRHVAMDSVVIFRVCGGHRPNRSECTSPPVSDRLWFVITRCWRQDPSLRLGIKDVVVLLNDAV
ncbi:hypothetical protein PLICRDRAFT_157531 [Plicaturopsis crispa FD-325 SS-3]|nr:hypothetical protein PLICRDRAFT_157531 [Plicaturopsis crispa FD-325 SS-3]